MISVSARRLLFWAAVVIAFAMAILPHPPEVPGQPNDKVQHIAAFTALSLLGVWAYARTPLLRLLVGLSLFGAFIELVQSVPALHRDCDVKDWIADTLACGAVLLLVGWRRSRQRGPADA